MEINQPTTVNKKVAWCKDCRFMKQMTCRYWKIPSRHEKPSHPSPERTNSKTHHKFWISFFFLSSSKKETQKEKKMVGANLKAETMKLMEKRSALETEMNVIIDRLCQPGGPGLSGNLVDSEAHKFSSSSFFRVLCIRSC